MSQTIVAPSRIGPFIFRGTVGAGAFSVVKLAYHSESKLYFAAKIVPRLRLSHDDLEERFEMEIRINQQMHHPGVVQIVDLLKDDLNYYIFMEFCPNGELFKYIINRKKLDEKETAFFMYQFLDSIRYVHSLGVAHRDLKPENLLLDSNCQLKISDFGLSKFVGTTEIVDTPCGSPCYASPECLSGQSYNGKKSDIWSIGVIMFAMCTGQLPWTKRNQAQLFQQIRNGDYKIPTSLSEECQDLIKKLMTVDPDRRITIVDALNHPFFKKYHLNSYNDSVQHAFSNQFEIVSLKKVDRFFDHSDLYPENETKDGENQGVGNEFLFANRNISQKCFSFTVAAKVIKSASGPFANYKPRRPYSRTQSNNIVPPYQLTQSLKFERTKTSIPSSSLDDIPQPDNQGGNRLIFANGSLVLNSKKPTVSPLRRSSFRKNVLVVPQIQGAVPITCK